MSVGSLSIVTTGILGGIAKAVITGSSKIRRWFFVAVGLGLIAFILLLLTERNIIAVGFQILSASLGIISVIIILSIYAIQTLKEEIESKEKIEKVEKRVLEHPDESKVAWELASLKLEDYLTKNLKQLKSIFSWTVIIMILGFFIIGYGIFRAYDSSDSFKPTLLTLVSGLIIEFIGATFLIVYKSTVQQAKEYVNVLERINAVGMSVQIVDRIESNQQLKNETGAEIAKLLLQLYGTNTILLSHPKT
jgi:hypothetical protein